MSEERSNGMKIEKIKIQNFRSIKKAEVYFGQAIAIVGANNSGKSHVLRALNAFFNYFDEKQSFINSDHVYDENSYPTIIVQFCNVVENDVIRNEYIVNNRLIIKAIFKGGKEPIYKVGKGKLTLQQDIFDKIISQFKYIYVPISRSASFVEQGIMHKLLHKILYSKTTKRNKALATLKSAYDEINKVVFGKAIRQIKKFYPFSHENNFELKIIEEEIFESIAREVSLHLKEYAAKNDLKNCGSGIQSAIFFAIQLAYSVDESVSYLVGIEEPEMNLHPQAQRELIEAFKDEKKYSNAQFIFTTHSPVMIDKIGHQSIVLCRKRKGEKRDIISTLTQLPIDFLDKYKLEEIKYNNFFEFKYSDLFFSKFLIITESSTDAKIFFNLLEKNKINPEKCGITFLPVGGELNVKFPYLLARELNIPFLCIVDKDVFLAYERGAFIKSLGEDGYPKYNTKALKETGSCYSFFNKNEKAELLRLLCSRNYSNLKKFLIKKNIITMEYTLEIDLFSIKLFLDKFCDTNNIKGDERNIGFLLRNRHSQIKKNNILLNILMDVKKCDLPESYKMVLKEVKNRLETDTP